jgi:hypothetical protein
MACVAPRQHAKLPFRQTVESHSPRGVAIRRRRHDAGFMRISADACSQAVTPGPIRDVDLSRPHHEFIHIKQHFAIDILTVAGILLLP